ncbi:sushi, von Willebrand factor type A, EGF and pentraxin domain-containing protein 1-like [Clavelina lepadiformis]|uniref:sushi, von Willebrand factor type A, EGF and pentraxin domain-containing protein 1-like n=1 Tax=Clavelina lepadiformis TaxID=159417 RepID=UPI0040417FAD
MRRTIIYFLLATFLCCKTKALVCWVCQNQPSNDHCLRNGGMKRCAAGQDACQNEIRKEHGVTRITKRCKQAHACGNNFAQNRQPAWEPTQCNNLEVADVSVCRCCCDTDQCNHPEQTCVGGPGNPYPTALPVCSALDTPQHGSKTCFPEGGNQHTLLETVCTFKCDKDYKLVGHQSSTCLLRNGRASFEHPSPICKANPTCTSPHPPRWGKKSCDKDDKGRAPPGTFCTFSCNPGYILRGTRTAVCMRTANPTVAKFNNKPPQCRPNPICDRVIKPRFGNVKCSRLIPGGIPPRAVCSFSCTKGYRMVGKRLTTCKVGPIRTKASFNNPVPSCVPDPMCDILVTPSFGLKECTDERPRVPLETECLFSCKEGYLISGKPRSTCLMEEARNKPYFDNPAPSCIANPMCDIIGTPQNGEKICTQLEQKVTPGAVCNFRCKNGYILRGLGKSTCRENKNPLKSTFDNPVPICQANPTCAMIATPPNGRRTCTREGKTVRAGTRCFFRCEEGYVLDGFSNSICKRAKNPGESTFDHPTPTCLRNAMCSLIATPRNGNKSCTQENHQVVPGTVCTFQCDQGFLLQGSQASTCRDAKNPFDAAFDNSIPVCIPNPRCALIATPQHGSKRCTEEQSLVLPETVCTFRCDKGYSLEGHQTSTCRDAENPLDAAFDHSLPNCTRNPLCDLIETPRHGNRSCTQEEHQVIPGTLCTFQCDEGFLMQGDPVSTCRDADDPLDAAFDNPTPVCSPNPMCELIGNPQHGSKTCTQKRPLVLPGTICTFKCNEGYLLQGHQRSICRTARNPIDAAFNNPVPICIANPLCDLVGTPQNGSKSCSQENNTVIPGTVCTFQCDEGFLMQGENASTCKNAPNPLDAAFDNPVPVCMPDPMCHLIQSPKHGGKICTQEKALVLPGTTCTFYCDEGYLLQGYLTSTCRDAVNPLEAAFDNPTPTCGPNPLCDTLATPQHGSISCTDENDQVTPGTICQFGCDEGYLLQGRRISTCKDAVNPLDAAFDNPIPICKPNPMCEIIATPKHGRKTCSEGGSQVFPETACAFQCNAGYLLQGHKLSTCKDAKNPLDAAFDNPVPVCIRNPLCAIVGTPQHGSKSCTLEEDLVIPGTVCTFQCDKGYLLQGNQTATCKDAEDPLDAAFNNPIPICIPNPLCDVVGIPKHGGKSCTREGNFLIPGTVCTFQCNEGFVMEGEQVSTCRDAENPVDAAFDNPVPVCIPNPMCELIGTPEHGSKLCTQKKNLVSPGTVCSFHCDEGYLLQGHLVSTCRDAENPLEASFDNPIPTCLPNPLCDLVATPQNGSKSCTKEDAKVNPGTVCTFECDEGFLLQGLHVSTCRDATNPLDASFDNPTPLCIPNPMCELIATPEHGSKNCTQDNFLVSPGTICTFFCDEGYVLQGQENSSCVLNHPLDATFNNPIPMCAPKPKCPVHDSPRFGNIACSQEGTDVDTGTTCQFSCDEGYVLVGDAEVICQEGEVPLEPNFDHLAPFCFPKPKCVSMESPEFGQKRCTQDGVEVDIGVMCTFECNEGYLLVGHTFSVCGEGFSPTEAVFNNPVPICKANPMCNVISSPQFGSKICTKKGSKVSPETVCTFSCNAGHYLEGSHKSTCKTEANGLHAAFDKPVPNCKPEPRCAKVSSLQNGTVVCSQTGTTFELGTICNFFCDVGFTVEGASNSTCMADKDFLSASFDNSIPTCKVNLAEQCKELEPIDKGSISCTMENRVGSACQFECDSGLMLYPANRTETVCEVASNAWSSPSPCCVYVCPNIFMNLVLILDSSGSIGEENWQTLLRFAAYFVGLLELAEDKTKVAVLTYSDDVDVKNQIRLTADKSRLKNRIKKLPWLGLETSTGKALRRARVSIRRYDRSRIPEEEGSLQNIVVLITDGAASDNAIGPAIKLRREATVFVVGVQPALGFIKRSELSEIAGDHKRVLFLADGYEELNNNFATELTELVCGSPTCPKVT